jgi:prophage DNA circulation protein
VDKVDAEEAAGIVQRMMTVLLTTVPSSGATGANARAAISDVKTNAYVWLRNNTLGVPLNNAFLMARDNGATYQNIEHVRQSVMTENPTTVGGMLTMVSGINLCLATESEIIATTTFISRQDVDAMKVAVRPPFEDSVEVAADEMDQIGFQAVVALYGALINHLVTTARPLPRLIGYRFAKIMPTLVIAQRLYADASRADEVRNENKIVHPAFCPLIGVALSA